jgi:thiol:disulfide interchange protein
MKAPMSFCKYFFSTLFALSLFATLPALAQPDDKHVAIRLLPSKTTVEAGETITIGIDHQIDRGWHTYWSNPGDSGAEARIQWSGLEDVKAAPIEWPAPKRLPMGPLMNFGYEDQVTLLQDITLPNKLTDEPITLTATVDILVCQEICIPETHQASFIINGDEEPVPAAVEIARSKLPLDMGWETKVSEDNGVARIEINTDQPQAFAKTNSIEIYPGEWGLIDNPSASKASLTENGLLIEHKRGDRALNDIPPTKIVIAYEDAQGARKAVRVSALTDAPVIANAPPASTGTIVKAVLLALLGGIVLNLMPCVFPVLSMKALSLVQLKEEEAVKARWHGIFYTLGILFSFTIIAALLLSLKAGGAQIGWGFQLQNPAMIVMLAYLFFLLGLNLAGYFEIDFGLSNIGSRLTQKAGYSGSFFTGVLATIVATPCTAPFMAAAVGFAMTQSAGIAIAIFLSLGFGLALPYLLLTLVPALRHALPRPGHWMETFRQFLAFPMFASALWLIWVLSQQVDYMGVSKALLGLLAIAFGIWLWKARPLQGIGRIIVIVLALGTFGYALSILATIHTTESKAIAPAPMSGEASEIYNEVLLQDYLKAGHPVFVNMTAAWCITCKVNEKVALNTDSIFTLFAQKNIKYLKGDWTNQNPEITKFLESYGRSGVPLYVYYGPRNEETGERPDAVLLPQLLTVGIVEKIILGE